MASAWHGHPAAATFDLVSEATGLALRAIADDADALGASTALAQPAIHAASMVAFDALLGAGIEPDVVAGHSLGEVTAAVAAGVMDRHEGAALVAERGRAMGDACAATPGTMAAIVRLDTDRVADLIADLPDVAIANHNAPGQVVVSGPADDIAKLEPLVREAGGRMLSLDVEGAFHSPAMAPALVRLDGLLRRSELSDPQVPLVSGVDARPRTSGDAVARALVDGVLAPVRWVDVQRSIVELGVDVLVEVGPGGVLAGCAKRTVPDLPRAAVAAPDDLDAVVRLVEDLADQPVAAGA
jgi:[acyl-carrier-protein] S-malonyltransferase